MDSLQTLEKNNILNSTAGMISLMFLLMVLRYALHGNMTSNELDTLLFAKQIADPFYLPGDWYLNLPSGARWLSHLLYHPLVTQLDLVKVSIISRVAGYLFVCIPLGLILRRLGFNTITAVLALGIFVEWGQSLTPSSEFIFGPTESKVFAYGLVFFALNDVLAGKIIRAGLLAGLATAMHVIVGGWSSMALGMAVLITGSSTLKERLPAIGLWLLAAAPSIYITVAYLGEAAPASPFDAKDIYVYFRSPHHLVPASWDVPWQDTVLALVIFWVLFRVQRFYPDEQRQPRLLALFTLWTAVPYLLGLLVSPFDIGLHFLAVYPFRVGSALVLLFGIVLAGPVIFRYLVRTNARPWVQAAVVLWCFSVGIERFIEDYRTLQKFPRGAVVWKVDKTQAMYNICDWVRKNTEPQASLLTNPALTPVPYLCNRGVVIRFKPVPYSTEANLIEWYQRLVALNGGEEPKHSGYKSTAEIGHHFRQLSAKQYLALGIRYDARYLLIRERDNLNLPLLTRVSGWDVYDLAPGISDVHHAQLQQPLSIRESPGNR